MKTLADGDAVEVQGSSGSYTLERKGDIYSCTCPAWRNQGRGINVRTCKHLRAYLGEAQEAARVGAHQQPAPRAKGSASPASKPAEAKAPPILLAHKWEIDHEPRGWWMSEKLDGVRAYWDGKAFVSRLGNRFDAPDWFVAGLPTDVTLDGELFAGRKLFQKTVSIVRRTGGGKAWKELAYVIFDAPAAGGVFEERVSAVQKLLSKKQPPYARWHEHVECRGFDHLREELARVEALGGEGLMLRRPGSHYEIGRSSSLLKVKTFHDAEARVIRHVPGAGKHKGRLGALEVELPDGTRFNVGTGFSDQEREAPPVVGAVITFRYQELSDDGVPRFPSYVGVRIDVELPKAARKSKPAPAPKQPAPAPAKPTTGDLVADLLVPGKPGKFWRIELRGNQHYTRFGRLGSPGQVRLSTFPDAAAARADAEKRAAAKRREGYRDA